MIENHKKFYAAIVQTAVSYHSNPVTCSYNYVSWCSEDDHIEHNVGIPMQDRLRFMRSGGAAYLTNSQQPRDFTQYFISDPWTGPFLRFYSIQFNHDEPNISFTPRKAVRTIQNRSSTKKKLNSAFYEKKWRCYCHWTKQTVYLVICSIQWISWSNVLQVLLDLATV